ncbi:MAG: hypothetical protein CL952_01730 [Erythrobacteraceae bacterium]|nr:hypothetical protein [Erythrobacteraceae bacterium]
MTQETKQGAVAATTTPLRNAVEATAESAYRRTGFAGNAVVGGTGIARSSEFYTIAFRAPAGRTWRYRGKRARVLEMLATTPTGITQWDTLPWHTRLGASIHVLRQDGLVIDTQREGDCRHARYRLVTTGTLIIQAENRGESA